MIKEATKQDIFTVALFMRDRDFAELSAINPVDTREALADALAERYDNCGLMCGWRDGRPVCIGGVIEGRPNVCSLLFFATDEFGEIALEITKFIKKRLIPPLIEAGAIRIDALSMEGHDQVHRWLETLGLSRETEKPLRNFGKGGESFVYFAWIKE